MDWLGRKEHLLQRLFENLFRQGRNAYLQPVEIAKGLAKKMAALRTVSISNVYVPNIYLVGLSPEDFQRLSAFGNSLARELEEYLSKKADEQNFTLVGLPQVRLEADAELPAGEMRIDARMEEGRAGKNKAKNSDDDRSTLVFAPINVEHNSTEQTIHKLIIISGPDSGRSFYIRAGKQTLGRQPACDFVLTDEQVSRRHCLLEESQKKVLLTDLGSRNGTIVDGKKIKQYSLEPGERFRIGRTVLELKLG